jgi:hypothetical protein
MKELVRCKACGYVMEAGKLKDVCPACGISAKVFEPYRERVASNRLFVLSLDLHPITIHLSQSFVIMIPLLMIAIYLFPGFQNELLNHVLVFSIHIFPLTLVAALITGIIDGLYRFKTLTPPLLKMKIWFSSIIIILAVAMFFVARNGQNDLATFILSLGCLYFAFRLGLLGKQLLNVILPGSYPLRKPPPGKGKRVSPQNAE